MTFITPTVKIDGFSLHDTANLRYVNALRVEDSTPQNVDLFKVAKSDRHKITAGWFDVKTIQLEGMIEATDNTLLIAKLDELKNALLTVGGSLFVSDGVSHRIWYVTTEGSVSVSRDKLDCVATWSVKFIVADPPYGIEADSSGNVLVNLQAFTLANTQNVFSPVFSGSARPTPRFQFTIVSSATPDLTGLEFLNRETGQSLSITFTGFTLANGDVLVIDSATRSVLFRGRPIAYDGTIPDWLLGQNETEVFFVTANSNIQVAAQKVVNDYEIVRDTVRVAQQFTPASGQNLAYVSLALSKILSPTGNVRVGLMADNSGNPSGTYLGGTVNIDMSTIKSKVRWFTIALAGAGITAGALYWLVADAPSATGGQTQHVLWSKSRQDQGFGNMKVWNGTSWVTGVGDMAFRAYTSNSTSQNQTVDTQNVFEGFDTTTRRDASGLATWDTANGYVKMTGTATPQVDTLNLSGTQTDLYGELGDTRFVAGSFTAGKTGTLQTVQVRLKRTSTNRTVNLKVYVKLYNPDVPDYTNLGSVDESRSYNSVSSSAFTDYSFTVNAPVTINSRYLVYVEYPSTGPVSGAILSVQTGSSTGNVRVTEAFTAGFGYGYTAQNSGIYLVTTISYLSYAGIDYATTTVLNTGNADIISASQYVITILLAGSVYQGRISANNGTNYQNITRNNAAFQTETIPDVVGNQLKWSGGLQNTVNPTASSAFITELTMYWREGISLDSLTKRASQSFQPSSTGTISFAKLSMMKLGSPGDLTVRIETDSAGSPSGTLVNANATATVSPSIISSTSFGLGDVNFIGNFSLTSGVTYHIVVIPTTTANDANKVVLQANLARYATGEMKRSTNSGTSYAGFTNGLTGYDLLYGMYGTGGSNFSANLDVTYSKLWL